MDKSADKMSGNKAENNYDSFIDAHNVIAVVGATPNKEKYGYKVFSALRRKGYNTYAVNPNHSIIYGSKCYPSLSSLPEKPDVVITVVKPDITLSIIRQCIKLNIKKIWMQPGSESEEAVELCKKEGLSFICNACFVVDGLKKDIDYGLSFVF